MEHTQQLIALVRDMRKWQKEYFKTRSPEALRWSKDMERRVDAELKAFDEKESKKYNPQLF